MFDAAHDDVRGAFHMSRAQGHARPAGRPLLILPSLLPATALAHGGCLDRHGGHVNRRTGEYHCPRAPCGQRQRERNDEERLRDQDREPGASPTSSSLELLRSQRGESELCQRIPVRRRTDMPVQESRVRVT